MSNNKMFPFCVAKEKIEEIRKVLNFYSNREYMQWEGCRCHGGYEDKDNGQKADEALKYLDELSELID